jgi:hypothetical protein
MGARPEIEWRHYRHSEAAGHALQHLKARRVGPLSMRLKKSTLIPISSADSSCVSFRCWRIELGESLLPLPFAWTLQRKNYGGLPPVGERG